MIQPLASLIGAPSVSAQGMHLVLILSLLFAVAMLRVGRKDP
jgi:hypothetical protein